MNSPVFSSIAPMAPDTPTSIPMCLMLFSFCSWLVPSAVISPKCADHLSHEPAHRDERGAQDHEDSDGGAGEHQPLSLCFAWCSRTRGYTASFHCMRASKCTLNESAVIRRA